MLWVPPPQIVPPPRNLWHGKNNHPCVSDQPRPHRAIIKFLQFSQLDRGSEANYKGELQIQWSTRTRPVPKGVRPQANNAGTVIMQRVQPHGPTRADQGALFLSTFNTKKINGEKGAFLRPTQKMLLV